MVPESSLQGCDLKLMTSPTETDMLRSSGFRPPHIDTMELPAHFAVWLCSQEASFLRGRFLWCNWDVEELKEKQAEIDESLVLTANCIGWPYPFAIGNTEV